MNADLAKLQELQEDRLIRLNRVYSALGATAAAIIRHKDASSLLQEICQICVDYGGIAMACAGLVDAAADLIVPCAFYDTGTTPESSGRIPLAPLRRDTQGLFATTIRTGQPSIHNDHGHNPITLTWPEAGQRVASKAAAAVPLYEFGQVVGAMGFHAAEVDYFDEEILGLVLKIANNVSFALEVFAHERARARTDQELHLKNRAIDASSNAVFILAVSASGHPVEYVNPAFERITGYSAGEAAGCSIELLCRNDLGQAGVTQIRGALQEQREAHAVCRNYRKDGALFWAEMHIAPVRDAAGAVTHFVGSLSDITEQKNYQALLERHTHYDPLTGLVNRTLLFDRLRQALIGANRRNSMVAVVFLNLDYFKRINDSLGRGAGDGLLKNVAERLLTCVRESDTVARMGGDDFVLVLPDQNSDDGLVHRLKAIAQSLTSDPATIGILQDGRTGMPDGAAVVPHRLHVTCSIGVSLYPQDGQDPDILLKHSDAAMYQAKQLGRDNFQFYTPGLDERISEQFALQEQLRQAVAREEFVLHYQPQVDLCNGAIVGVEALIRWQHPERGLLAPSHFIALAEETGLIIPIGAWVMRAACLQSVAWQKAGLGRFRMAVNLSARQFVQADLAQVIEGILDDTGLHPDCLELELTESMIMTNVDRSIAILRDLKALGVQLSIDDFGTGYSSLSYLKRFPIDVLKIDQSFVRDITVDINDAVISKAIISMAHDLGVRVIAEGVETEGQCDFLRQHMCDEIQGYFFSRPLAPAALEALVREDRRLPPHLLHRHRKQRSLLLVDEASALSAATDRQLQELLAQTGAELERRNQSG